MGNVVRDKEPIDSSTKTEAKDVSHFSAGDFYRAFQQFFAMAQKNVKSVPLNRHKTGRIPSYRGLVKRKYDKILR